MKNLLLVFASLNFLACAAHAIDVVNSEGASIASGSFTYDYNVQQSDSVLVVATYRDGGGSAYPSLDFGGDAHDGSLVGNRTSLFYYLAPSVGNLTINTTANNASNSGIYIWELSGVDLNAPVASAIGAEGDALNTQISTFGDNTFVVDAIGWNPSGVLDTTTVELIPDVDNSVIAAADFVNTINLPAGGVLGGGTGTAGAAGTYDLGWTINQSEGSQLNLNELAFGFAPPGSVSVVSWALNGGGDWSTGSNWSSGSAPVGGGSALFGSSLTPDNAPANISLDTAGISVSKVTFSNQNTYNITGPNTLSLTGSTPEIETASGTHDISARIVGSNGLTKTGAGALRLSGANTYSGRTDVEAGALQLASAGTLPGDVDLAAASQLAFVAGHDGAYGGTISGSGAVVADASLTTETATLTGSNSYEGQTIVRAGTLAVGSSSALGLGGDTAASGTTVDGLASTGKLALVGGVTINNEVLTLGAREGEAADAVHVTNSGSNTWNGAIRGDLGGVNYNLESTSGTLTLGGTISGPDVNPRTFVFSGDGNFAVTGKITDVATDVNGAPPADTSLSVSESSNVNVVKSGNGTLTVSTETNVNADYWYGSTVVEPGDANTGRLTVTADAGDNGELRSSSITVQNGATLDISDFGTYSLWTQDFTDESYAVNPAPSSLSGGGTIDANANGTRKTLRLFEANTVSPGDGVGALTLDGNLLMTYFDNGANEPPTQPIVPDTGSFNFELGSDHTIVDGAGNDVIAVTGDVTINQLGDAGANQWAINVTAVDNELAGGGSGSYTLIDAGGSLSGSANNSNFAVALSDATGSDLTGTTRQNLSVNMNTSTDALELVVSGSAGNLTWTGAGGNSWDVNSSSNWSGGQTFFNLDYVRFDDTAGANTTADVSSTDVTPGTVTFDSSTGKAFTITGSNGIRGAGAVDVSGNATAVLAGNNEIAGPVSVASNATLQLAGTPSSRTTLNGVVSGSGTWLVSSGDHVVSGDNTFSGAVTINGGQLNMNSATALGDTAVGATINTGGTLASFADTYTTNEPLTFNGGRLLVGDGGTPTVAGPVTINAGGAVVEVQDAASTLTLASAVSGSGALTKTGAGTLAVGETGSIAASPEVSVNGGTLDVTAQGGLAVANGQTLAGSNGVLLGQVSASNGSTIRVGQAVMPELQVGRYIDATVGAGGNTELASGGVFNPVPAPGSGAVDETNWVTRSFANGGAVLQGATTAENPNGVPVLKTTITGLTPGESYTVHANFWDDDFSAWRLRAGASEAGLTVYGSPLDGVVDATDALDPNASFAYESAPLTTEGNRLMWGAEIGVLMANASGEIEVFIDEASAVGGALDRSWYDGVSVSTGAMAAIGETFTIDGDLSLDSGSTLAVNIGSPGVNDLLNVTGGLSVDGGAALLVTLDSSINASSLQGGDTWDLLDFASGSASFDPANLILPSGLDSELSWAFVQATGVLSVVEGGLSGDFNGDGSVNAADYTVWRDSFGTGDVLPNDGGLGTPISSAHYDLWRDNYGSTLLGGVAAATPEPSSLGLLALLLVGSGALQRKK